MTDAAPPQPIRHWHRAFELRIASAVALPELPPSDVDETADVEIVVAPLDDNSLHGFETSTLLDDARFASTPGRCLIELSDGTRFLIEDGRRITIDCRDDAGADAIRPYLVGSCLGAVLHQRGLLALHGSAIDTPRGAVVFVGQSGKGKSTIAASFHARGYGLLTDDVSAIVVDADDRPWVLPAYPRLKLMADAARHPNIGIESAGLENGKHLAAVDDAFVRTRRPLAAIIHLRTFPVNEVRIDRLSPDVARAVLHEHVFRRCLLSGLGIDSTQRRLVEGVVGSAAVYRTVRPRDGDSLCALTDLIAEEITRGDVHERLGADRPDHKIGDGARVQRSRSAVFDHTDDGVMITTLDANDLFELDAIGGRVWELLASPRTLRELVDTLRAEYDVSPAACEADVRTLLVTLQRHELLEAAL